MTAVKPVLDTYLELNIVLGLSALMWLGVWVVLARTRARFAYIAQLRALKALIICVALSPVLAFGTLFLAAQVWPDQPVAIGDIAVAAYLRGEIAMPAIQFETLLNTRQRWFEGILYGHSQAMLLGLALFATIAMLLMLRAVRDALKIRATINGSFLWRRSAQVDIRLSDRTAVPFAVRGLMRRHVVLPSHLLDKPRELRFALAHEFQHVRDHDVEWELALELLRPLFFWNPGYLFLKYQFERLRELSCDQSVVVRRGLDARSYTRCLLDYCARTVTAGQPRVLNVALVNGNRAKAVLRQRVLALTDAPSGLHSGPVLFLGLTLVFALMLALGSASVQQTQDWSHDRLMLSTVVNLERLAEINRGN